MSDMLDPTAPDYVQRTMANQAREQLEAALTRCYMTQAQLAGLIEKIKSRIAADLAAEQEELLQAEDLNTRLRRIDTPLARELRLNAVLSNMLEVVRRWEHEFLDQPGFSLLAFRKWFIQAEFGLDCEKAAIEAMTSWKIPVDQKLFPAFRKRELQSLPDRMLLDLRQSMVDYLLFDGLSRYELAQIARAQLGLLTINGSVPQEWHGLSFRDMVLADFERRANPERQPAFVTAIRLPQATMAAVPN